MPAPEAEPLVLLAASAASALGVLQSDRDGRAVCAFSAAQLIAERADRCGFALARARSAGGSCRLLPTATGMMALNLARPQDWDLLPALLGEDVPPPADWAAVAALVATRDVDALVATGALIGMAIARADAISSPPLAPHRIVASGGAVGTRPSCAPFVLDMSALWAGPLCGHLLERMGARVVKLEGQRRNDGARAGDAGFYALLNQGKSCVALDFDRPEDRAILIALIDRADIVIESARPRALRHIGIDAEAIVRARPGLVWVAISGYGRGDRDEQRVAYGDDAAAAAGLCAALHRATGRWAFVEDAVADPVTGIQAARVAWEHWRAGRGALITLALRDVAAWSLAQESAVCGEPIDRRLSRWYRQNGDGRRRGALPPRAIERPPRAPGADNGAITDLLARC